MSEVYVTKTITTVKDDIFYLIKNGEISFFYKEFLLFKHNKNNPVVSIILTNGEAEKEVPLINYDINKININEYDIEFYYQIYKVKFYLKLENNLLNIKVKNSNKYYGIKLSVKNSVGKLRGLGLNKEELTNGKELCSNLYEEEKESYLDDKLLAFFKEKKYFVNVEGNYEWKLRLGSLIEMYFKKTSFLNIKVLFCKEHEKLKGHFPLFSSNIFEDKGIIVKTTIKELESLLYTQKSINRSISAVILCDDYINFWELQNVREKLKKLNIKVLRKVQMKISEKDDYFNQFGKGDFVKAKNGKILVENSQDKFFYFDLTNTETCRKVKNYVRRILGTNIDGLVSVEKENKILVRQEYKDIQKASSMRWQKILYQASLEYYTPKTLIFDTLSPITYSLGYFLIESKSLSNSKYKKQLENLKFSGIFNTVIGFDTLDSFTKRRLKRKVSEEYNIIYNK